jgi:hypothetical protein
MGKLARQLSLAEAPKSRGRHHRADGHNMASFRYLGEVSQLHLTAHEQRIRTEGEARDLRE